MTDSLIGPRLQQVRLRLRLRQADVAGRIPLANGEGMMTDARLSLVEKGHVEPTRALIAAYLDAIVSTWDAEHPEPSGSHAREER